MKFRSTVKLLLLLLCAAHVSRAQIDTVITSPPVEVIASALRISPVGSDVWIRTKTEEVPNTAQDLGTILSEEANVYVKSYGLGSLATTSIRGGQAGHTLVLWNKLPLSSPMLGLTDLALITASDSDDLRLIKGGNSALWGSGAVDGTIIIDDEKSHSPGLSLSATAKYGSFGSAQHHYAFKIGRQTWESKTQWMSSRARNDFPYVMAFQLPQERQVHAAFSQQQIKQDFYWERNGSCASVHYWYNDVSRQIPPNTTQAMSEATQDDQSHRLSAKWHQSGEKDSWQSSLGYAFENQRFKDPLAGINNRNQFNNVLADLTYLRYFDNSRQWEWGTSHSVTHATTAAYSKTVQEWRSSLFTSYREWHRIWQWQFTLRQDLISGGFSPISPLLGLEIFLKDSWSLKGKVSRNFRHPTLNHRFWRPGGNIHLKPEQGWEQEITAQTDLSSSPGRIKISLTAFNRTIKNWILWRPELNKNYWAPENLSRVWSRGLDFHADHFLQLGQIKFHSKLNYQLTKSTNQNSLKIPKINAGDQLIYTPVHLAAIKINLYWKGIHLYYLQRYTGSTQGINEGIEEFTVADTGVTYNSKWKGHTYRLFFNLNNIWNRDYFIIERRPMPGLNWDAGIKFNFNHKKNSFSQL